MKKGKPRLSFYEELLTNMKYMALINIHHMISIYE